MLTNPKKDEYTRSYPVRGRGKATIRGGGSNPSPLVAYGNELLSQAIQTPQDKDALLKEFESPWTIRLRNLL